MGIEPTSKAWEAFVLPLNYTRERFEFYDKCERPLHTIVIAVITCSKIATIVTRRTYSLPPGALYAKTGS